MQRIRNGGLLAAVGRNHPKEMVAFVEDHQLPRRLHELDREETDRRQIDQPRRQAARRRVVGELPRDERVVFLFCPGLKRNRFASATSLRCGEHAVHIRLAVGGSRERRTRYCRSRKRTAAASLRCLLCLEVSRCHCDRKEPCTYTYTYP